MTVLVLPRPVVLAAQNAAQNAAQSAAPAVPASAAPANAAPPATPAKPSASAVDDFVDRAQGRMQGRWQAAWVTPTVRTLDDLDPAVLGAARAAMKEVGSKSPAFRGIAQLIADEGFEKLDRTTQLAFVKAAQDNPSDPTVATDLRHLSHSRVFQAIDPKLQPEIAAGFGDSNVSAQDRERFVRFMARKDVQALDPKVKDAVIAAYAHNLGDPKQAQALLATATANPNHLSPEVMAGYLKAIGRSSGPIDLDDMEKARGRIDKLAASPEFAGLDETSKQRWMAGLGDPDDKLRARSHARLDEVLANGFFTSGDAAMKDEVLRRGAGALSAPSDVQADRDPLPGASTKAPTVTHDGKTTHSKLFMDGQDRPADRYVVNVDGQKIEVFIPKDRDPAQGEFPNIDRIAATLAGLPKNLRKNIDQVIIEPARIAGDPFMVAGQKDAKHKNRVFVAPQDTMPDRLEMTATLSHETGHIVAGNAWVADRSKFETWKKGMYADDKWPSFYAAHSVQEDVAETTQLYYQVKGTPAEADMKRDFPNRYAMIKELLGD